MHSTPPVQHEYTPDAKPVVLVIDDSVDVHRLLRARLSQEELSFISAYSGAEGLVAAERMQPSLITLDLNMEGMDGFEVLKQLKAKSITQQIPVIILSTQASRDDKVKAFDLGAVDYIAKPFEFTELRVRVRSAIRVYQLVQMLAQKAKVDGLTGLWNRAFFDGRWTEEFARSSRYAQPLSVMLLDCDRFKSINDDFGHPAGDALLQGLARIIQRECRQTDLACRYGGEEFIVIMPSTGCEEATVLAERIRVGIEAATWPRHAQRKVTISIGVAGCSGAPALSAEAWIEVVDQNLYRAKKEGRNRVISSEIESANRSGHAAA
ncbi:MAG: diguanylate cyclase [Phycisphaerales bacterium]